MEGREVALAPNRVALEEGEVAGEDVEDEAGAGAGAGVIKGGKTNLRFMLLNCKPFRIFHFPSAQMT